MELPGGLRRVSHDIDESAPLPDGTEADLEALEQGVIEALRQVYDPEIPVNIYDLGLIYGLELREDGHVKVVMTLTAPGCPVAQTFPGVVQNAVMGVSGVSGAEVELVWEPPWDRDRMSEAAKLQLGML